MKLNYKTTLKNSLVPPIKKRRGYSWVTHISILIIVSISMLSLSCAGKKTIDTTPVRPPMPNNYVVMHSGDEVEIKFAYSPEFNEIQRIRPDGKLMLLLLGEVEAAGKTPEGLRKELIPLYTKHLSHPDLTITIRESVSQRVYVGGSVDNPGALPHYSNLSALDAIMESGGFVFPAAKANNVIVIRFKDGKRQVYSLNLKDVILGKAYNDPFYLEPHDIVYVPRTTISKVARWVDENFWDIFQIRYGIVYDLSD